MWFVENDYKYPLFFDNINSLPLRSCQRPTLPIQGDNIKPHPTPLLAVTNFLCIKSLYLDTIVFKNFVNFPTKSCLANSWRMYIKRLYKVFQSILLAKMLVILFCNECSITWRARQKNMSSSSSGSHLGIATTPPYRQATKLSKQEVRVLRSRDISWNLEKFGQDYCAMLRGFFWKWVIH